MIHGFDTEDHATAVAALLVYAVWRSRDARRFKITPDVWGLVERSVKASAKRAATIPEFLEKLKPKLLCATISPRWMAVGISGDIPMVVTDEGYRMQIADDGERREFLARVIGEADAAAVLRALYRETAFVILLARDRLERERPLEQRFPDAFRADEEAG